MLLLACLSLWAAGFAIGWPLLALAAGAGYLALLAVAPKRLADSALLAPLFDAGVVGHAVAMLLRLPHLLVLFLGTWLPFWFFDVNIPLQQALVYIPILLVAVTLPITPQGVGTRDALAALFFAPFAVAEGAQQRLAAVAAATTSTAVVLVLVEVVLSIVMMRRVTAMMRRAVP